MGDEKRGYNFGRRDFIKIGLSCGMGLYGCKKGGRGNERRVSSPNFVVRRKFENHFGDEGKVQFEYFASDDRSIIDEVYLKYNTERNYSVFRVIGQDSNGRLRFSSDDDAVKKLITSANNNYKTFVRNRNSVNSKNLNGEFNVLERPAVVSIVDDIFHKRGVFNNPRYDVEFKGEVDVQVGVFLIDADYIVKNRENGKQSLIRAVGFGRGENLQNALDERRIARRDGRYHCLYLARAPRELVLGEVNKFIDRDFVDFDRNIFD